MNSDDIKPAPDRAFRQAGPGHPYSMRCGKCSIPMRNYGRRLQLVRGAKVWVCKACQEKRS